MENRINVACNGCDYFDKCSKELLVGEDRFLAKKQDKIPMKCQSVVQQICRDCTWYLTNRCASWKELNGKKTRSHLTICPRKIKVQ